MSRRLVVVACFAACVLFLACGKSPQPPKQAATPAQQAIAETPPPQLKPGLWIIQPGHDTTAPYRAQVFGTLSDTTIDDVWVLVHPLGVNEYWVQSQAGLRSDGLWMDVVYLGLENTQDGVKFEVRAFAGVQGDVKPGTKMTTWPTAKYGSNTLVLSRLGK